MDLRSVSELQSTSSTARKQSASELDQNDFLKLMLQQLKNQDPFKPMDNSQFVAQMAQFSTVSGIGEMKNSFAAMAESLHSAQLLNATSLIGKQAVVASNFAQFDQGGSVNGQVEVPVNTQGVIVEITTITGQVVDRMQLGPQSAGPVNFSWDGRSSNGDTMPSGQYMIRASYFNGNSSEALDTYIKATIDSVSVPAGGGSPQLYLNGLGAVSLSDLKEIA